MKLTCGTLSDWVLRECWLAPWYQWMAVHKGSFWSIELTLICRTGIVFCKSKECLYSPASNPNDYTRYLFQSQVTQPFTERHPGVTLTVLGWWSWMVQICRSIILMVRGPERLQLATKSTTVWSILIEQVFIAVNGLFVFFAFENYASPSGAWRSLPITLIFIERHWFAQVPETDTFRTMIWIFVNNYLFGYWCDKQYSTAPSFDRVVIAI